MRKLMGIGGIILFCVGWTLHALSKSDIPSPLTDRDVVKRAMSWSGLKRHMTVRELKDRLANPIGNITILNKDEVLKELRGLPDNRLLERGSISPVTTSQEKKGYEVFHITMGGITLHLEHGS